MKWYGIVALIWAVVSIFIVKNNMAKNNFHIQINERNYTPNFLGKWLMVFLVPLAILLLLIIVLTIAVPVFFAILLVLFIIIGVMGLLYFLKLFL